MYAETGLFSPYMQNFSQDFHFEQFEDYCKTQKPNASMNNLVQTSVISEYNLDEECDMFKALEPIIEEPIVGHDSMTAAISLLSCGEDMITSQGLKAADMESFQNERLLEVLYECEKDLMAAVLDVETPIVKIDENQNQENKVLYDALFQKCESLDCLSSVMECMQGAAIEPKFLDFLFMDVYGMRRAFSEGDIEACFLTSDAPDLRMLRASSLITWTFI